MKIHSKNRINIILNIKCNNFMMRKILIKNKIYL